MPATTAAHSSLSEAAATDASPSSTVNLGLRVLAKQGPLATIAIGLAGFLCWQLVTQHLDMKQMHEEHAAIVRLLYAQCINAATGDAVKVRTCLDAFQGR